MDERNCVKNIEKILENKEIKQSNTDRAIYKEKIRLEEEKAKVTGENVPEELNTKKSTTRSNSSRYF